MEALALIGAIWLFLGSSAFIAVILGAVGAWIARRRGRQCPEPECDYRGDQADLLIHRVREH